MHIRSGKKWKKNGLNKQTSIAQKWKTNIFYFLFNIQWILQGLTCSALLNEKQLWSLLKVDTLG